MELHSMSKVIISAVFLAASLALVVACGPGAYLAPGDVCTQCTPGTYQPGVNETSCITCPDGNANPNTGSTTVDDCSPCSPGSAASGAVATCPTCVEGTYAPLAEMAACTNCQAGYYATNVTGSTSFVASCLACPAGTEKPSDDPGFIEACTTCADGEYNPFTGNAECAVCGQGGEVNEDRTECSTASSGGVTGLDDEQDSGAAGINGPIELTWLVSLATAGGCLIIIVAYALLAPDNRPAEDVNDALSKFYLTEEQRRSSSGKGSRGAMASSARGGKKPPPKKGPGSAGLRSAGGKKKAPGAASRSRSNGKKKKASKGLGIVNAAMV